MRNRIFVCLVCLAMVISGCEIKFKSGQKNREGVPDLILGDFMSVIADDSGKRVGEIKASDAKMYDNKDDMYLFNLTVTYYNDKNELSTFMSADRGLYNKKNRNVIAEGNVRLYSTNNLLITCARINWNNSKRLFSTEPKDLVTIHKEKTLITGYQLQGNLTLSELKLLDMKANINE